MRGLQPTSAYRPGTMYVIYVDDSGDENRLVFSGLAIPEHRWSAYLKGWDL